MRSLTWGLLALIAFGCLLPAEARTWKDRTGKHQIEAELVAVRDGKVVLKKPDGKQIAVPLQQLSEEDQQFAQQQASAPAPGKQAGDSPVRLEVLAVSIARPLSESLSQQDKQDMMMAMAGSMPGTQLRLLLSSSTKQFVGMDEQASALTRLADDKGTVLAPTAGGRQSGFGTFSSSLLQNGRLCAVEIRAPAVPASGATKLIAQGELVLRCGEGEKTVESEPLDLAAGGKLNLGSTPVTVKQAGEGMGFRITGFGSTDSGDTKMSVTLSAQAPLDMIKSLTFLDPEGKVIKHQRMGSSSMGFAGQMTHEVTYGLAQKVSKLKVKVVQFERVELLKVPLSLEVGVGL